MNRKRLRTTDIHEQEIFFFFFAQDSIERKIKNNSFIKIISLQTEND